MSGIFAIGTDCTKCFCAQPSRPPLPCGKHAHAAEKFLVGALFLIFFPQILVGEVTFSCHTLGSEAERSTDGVAGARAAVQVPLLFFEYFACAACRGEASWRKICFDVARRRQATAKASHGTCYHWRATALELAHAFALCPAEIRGQEIARPMTQTRGRFGIGICAVLALASVGCGESGPATAHLSGTITIGGQPLPADATGQVMFVPAGKDQGKPATAVITNGQYDSPNTPQGPVKVGFVISQPTGPEYTTDRGVKTRNTTSIVPASAAAGMDIDVTGDNTAQNFDLK
jgi:hypothetical protein